MKKLFYFSFMITAILLGGCSLINPEKKDIKLEITERNIEIIQENNDSKTNTDNKNNPNDVVEKEKDDNSLTNTNKPNNEVSNQKVYKNSQLGIQFMYPENWIIREEITEFNNRIYIENQENKNYTISNFPEDFMSMWIEYRKPNDQTQSYEDRIKLLDSLNTKKEIVNTSMEINIYEFAYNPHSEQSGYGPYLDAVRKDTTWIYNARTMNSSNKKKNEEMVNIGKQILGTITKIN